MKNPDVSVDTSGESCPIPVMKCSKEMRKMTTGQVLFIKATDPASVNDIRTLLSGSKNTLLESSQVDGTYHFYIQIG